jgi:hypothetical protein
MATQIDSVDILGMKHADFAQLLSIFEHVMDEGIYWGRKDYWDDRNKRIEKWLNDVIMQCDGNKIKQIKEQK